MKKHWMLLVALFLLSCSDDNGLDNEEPGTNEPEIEVVEPEAYRANRMLIKHGLQLQCWVATDNYELDVWRKVAELVSFLTRGWLRWTDLTDNLVLVVGKRDARTTH